MLKESIVSPQVNWPNKATWSDLQRCREPQEACAIHLTLVLEERPQTSSTSPVHRVGSCQLFPGRSSRCTFRCRHTKRRSVRPRQVLRRQAKTQNQLWCPVDRQTQSWFWVRHCQLSALSTCRFPKVSLAVMSKLSRAPAMASAVAVPLAVLVSSEGGSPGAMYKLKGLPAMCTPGSCQST